MMAERRKTPRQRTLLAGRIAFNQRDSTLDCLVRNLSEQGALLLVSDAVALPTAFDLEVLQQRKCHLARIRWRDAERIGIVFEQTRTAEIVPLDLARRLKQCEIDNRLLKTRIRHLTESG